MTIAKLEGLPEFDLGRKSVPWKTRRAEGKALRDDVPRESHTEWKAPKNRPDPVATVLASNKGRQDHLIPLRMGRMAASPFAFLRGSACVMAADLSTTPISRIPVVMDGDAHLNNFGMYGTTAGGCFRLERLRRSRHRAVGMGPEKTRCQRERRRTTEWTESR